MAGSNIGGIRKTQRIHDRYGCKAWICGRITMEENFTLGNKLDLKQEYIPFVTSKNKYNQILAHCYYDI